MKTKFEVGFGNWNLRIQFEVETFSLDLKLTFIMKLKFWVETLELQFEDEICSSKFKFNFKLTSEVETRSQNLNCIDKMNIKVKFVS